MHIKDILPSETKPKAKQHLMTSIFSPIPKSQVGLSCSDKKWIITRQIALMCCEDLLPFDVVQKPGFVKFLLKNNVIKNANELPDARTVVRCGLQTVYEQTVSAVKAVINESPKTIGVTTDMWTDNYRRRSYMTVTVHFCLRDFTMQSMVLCTSVFTKVHTGDNIAAELKKIIQQFGIGYKNIIYITDQGSNMIKACRIAGWERYGCSAHGLHNLIAVDGILHGHEARDIICKVKDIIKTFAFKMTLLETEAAEMANEEVIADLERLIEEMDEGNQISMSSGAAMKRKHVTKLAVSHQKLVVLL